jgi:hypothetical protein
MDYQIALDPDLGLSPADFAAAWNETDAASTTATITLASSDNKSYFDPVTTTIIVTAASTISLGVVTNAIYDVLKAAFVKKGKPHKHTKITRLKQADGTELLVVDEEEG